jgi:hypothetical protein
VSFAAITLCVASQRVFIVVSVYFVIDSVRKLLVYTFVWWLDLFQDRVQWLSLELTALNVRVLLSEKY